MGEFREALSLLDKPAQPRLGRPRFEDPSAILHAKIVWSAWVLAEGGEEALRARYQLGRPTGNDEKLVFRSDVLNSYKRGARTLSPDRKIDLAKNNPVLTSIFQWPLGLLSLEDKSDRWIAQSINPYLSDGVLYPNFVFPGEDQKPCTANRRPVAYPDLESLYERGDVYGFIAIAAVYRKYQLERLHDSQWAAACYLIRALPGFCREPCVRPHAELAIHLTKSLLVLLPDTSFRIVVDDDILWQQINNSIHEPCRALRLEAARCGKPIDAPADPIVPFTYRRCRSDQVPLILGNSLP